MTLFFTSDLHLGHARIIELCNRPFDSVEHMNDEIIRRWNETVTDDDEVYVLGDVALGKIKESLPLVNRLNGTKHLIYGNHDRCFPSMKNSHKPESRQMYFDAGFVDISSSMGMMIGDFHVKFSHFPYEGDSHGTDRFKQYRLVDEGLWIVHGHVHDEWQVKDRQVNVGVDVWDFYPVPVDRIETIMIGSSHELPRPPEGH